METLTKAALAALLLAAVPLAASASMIVDTGAPMDPTESWSLFGENIPPQGQYLAARFNLDHAAVLTRVEGYLAGYGGTFTVSIASDGAGDSEDSTPFLTLYSHQVGSTFAPEGAWSGLQHANWALDPGNYWVVFSVLPSSGDSFAGSMPNNAPHPTGAEAVFDMPDGAWVRQDDLDFGVRIGDGAPEPAAWALMISGFGLAGGALRRRLAAVA